MAVEARSKADLRPKNIKRFIRPLVVPPGRKVKLANFDPASTSGFTREDAGGAQQVLQDGVALLSTYQSRLAAQSAHALLVILQAMDAAGKDGTIRHVMSGVNPQGVDVQSFKVPTADELAHDYLWRYARRVPAKGRIGIFNRSYYEEVLVVRVHPQLLKNQRLPDGQLGHEGDESFWARRFREINNYERYLSDNGIHIVKLFLNVSKEAQRERFLSRLVQPEKNWKFTGADVRERAFWEAYQAAFSDVLSHTSTAWAPWYVIPADHKWFSRLAAAGIIANALIEIDPQYPIVGADAKTSLEAARHALESEGQTAKRSAKKKGSKKKQGGR
jgi:PPK2 family polyphosphate:nucleotide phosphotransferase